MKSKYKIKIEMLAFRLLMLAWIVACLPLMGNAQSDHNLNREMQAISKPTSKWGWIDFTKESNINPYTIFNDYKNAFELSNDDQMQFQKVITDKKIGNNHYCYQQYYKGVKIDGAEFIVRQKVDGKVKSANGKIAVGLNLNVSPSISESEALKILFDNYVDKTKGAWHDVQREIELKESSKNSQATFYPKGELLIHRIDLNQDIISDNLLLVWKFEVRVIPGANSLTYYIDAQTGSLVNSVPIAKICNSGSISTVYYGNRTVYSNQNLITGNYVLNDDCSSHTSFNIHTKNANFSNPSFSGAAEFTSSTVNWNSSNTKKSGAMVHWCVEKTEEYYRYVQNNSPIHNSDNIEALANYDHGTAMGNGNNACWNCENDKITVGYGSSATSINDDLATLDIIGHEFTHGIIEYTAGLVYSGESGAINESISDCFGEVIQEYILNSTNWLVGDALGAFRSLIHPKDYGDPDTYLGINWSSSGAVHTNSGVGNHWFYLLSEGGSGTNDNGEVFSVEGVGIDTAADILFYTLNNAYMTSTAGYNDFREATIHGAQNLYGDCSNAAIQVGKAWYAVGVNPSFVVYNHQFCGTINGGTRRGINSVQSGGPGCSTTVDPSSSSVIYAGGNFVLLDTGFVAYYNGTNTFSAITDDCSFTTYLRNSSGYVEPHNNSEFNLEEVTNDKIKLIPNPSFTFVSVIFEYDRESKYEIQLLDITGRLVKSDFGISQLGENNRKLVLDGMSKGIYQIVLMINGKRFVKKLVVE